MSTLSVLLDKLHERIESMDYNSAHTIIDIINLHTSIASDDCYLEDNYSDKFNESYEILKKNYKMHVKNNYFALSNNALLLISKIQGDFSHKIHSLVYDSKIIKYNEDANKSNNDGI